MNDEMFNMLHVSIGASVECVAGCHVVVADFESVFAPVSAESSSLHVAHLSTELTTGQYRILGRWRVVRYNSDRRLDSKVGSRGEASSPGRTKHPHLDSVVGCIGHAIDVLKDLVTELLRDSKKGGLT